MASVQKLITDNIAIWSSAVKEKSTVGRGSSKKIDLYGIKKLRELILELAMRGLLVPQDPDDESADVICIKISSEREQLISTKKIKDRKLFLEISSEDEPFKLPKGWIFKRFSEVLDFSGGSQPPKSVFSDIEIDGYVQLIQIRDLGPNPQPVYVPEEMVSKLCTTDDIMIGRYGASVGKVFWGKNGAYNVALIKLHNDIKIYDNSFLFNLMISPIGQSLFSGISRSAQAGFSKDDIAPKVIPIPPLKEQHRIVAKVDELMALCDQLEQQTEASISAHQILVQTLLGTLTNTSDRNGLTTKDGGNAENAGEIFGANQAWARITEHFDTLFTTEWSIDQLKQTILQLAVMGKLVPQNPNDEPASVLLKKIATEKAKLIKEGKIKKQKTLSPITEDEKPFELPAGWEWVRFGNLVNIKAELVRPEEFQDCDQVAPDSIEKGTGKLLFRRTVAESGIRGPNSRFYKGQIIYSKIRPSLSKAIIAEFDGLCSADMYPLDAMVNSQHLLKLMLSEVFLIQVRAAENRIKMPKLNIESLSNIIVPLAPEKMQSMIVDIVEIQMTLCDTLKTHINTAQITQLRLADAMAEQAIN